MTYNYPRTFPFEGTAIATKVNTAALIRPVLSVLKLRRPIARPPRTTVNCSHDKNVRSFAKNTTC